MNTDTFNRHVRRHFELITEISKEGSDHEMFYLVNSDERAQDVACGLEAALRRGGSFGLLSGNDLASISTCLNLMYWLGYQRAQRESTLANFQVAGETQCDHD